MPTKLTVPKSNNNNGLIVAIIFAALAISGSLVFFATKLAGGINEKDLQAQVSKGIDAYIEDQQKEYEKTQADANKPRVVEGDFSDDDAFLGEEDAPVTIVEFSDYQCPYCKAFYTDTLPAIKEKYIDTGKVKLIYRDLPLSIHPYAYPAALIAECVREQTDDSTYFEMHDYIFENIAAGFDFETYSAFAATLGADESKLKGCFDSDKYKSEIDADSADADKAGISGTPGFIINNQAVSGARPFEYFKNIIEEELAKQ